MTISHVLELLETSSHPVARVMRKTINSKVLVLGLKAGMELKDHTTPYPSQLLVIEGAVDYREGAIVKRLNKYDETIIPVDIKHEVVCISAAICLLIQG